MTLQGVFVNVLKDGYEGHREPLEVMFSGDDDAGNIVDFSVGYVDGFQRALSVLGVLHYLILLEREPPPDRRITNTGAHSHTDSLAVDQMVT